MTFEDIFNDYGELHIFDKQEYIFRQGEKDSNIYLVKSGLIKASYITGEGKEFIKSFLIEGDIIGSLNSAHFLRENCSFSLVCLEKTQLVSIAFDTLLDKSKSDAELSQLLIQNLLMLAMKKEKREYELLCLSPEQRYQLLKEKRPEVLEKVTQNDIARYLGITPVALSRIRKRIIGMN